MSAPPQATPSRSLRAAGILFLAGIVLIAIGAIATVVAQASQAALAADRAEIPDSLEFEAQAGSYRILLLPNVTTIRVPFVNNAEAYFNCDVTRADGSSIRIDTASAFLRSSSEVGIELGEFETVAGPTTVVCAWKDGRDSQRYYYSVAPASPALEIGSFVAVLLGIGLLVLGALLTARSYLARLRNVRPLP